VVLQRYTTEKSAEMNSISQRKKKYLLDLAKGGGLGRAPE
jgi:hypothetical protein